MRQFQRHLQLAILLIGVAVLPALSLSTTQKEVHQTNEPKLNALKVLQTKCNVCHKSRNPGKVFNLDNMSVLAPKIYKQVFLKKRMPKGKTNKLTNEEYVTLQNWLNTENIY